MASLMVGDNLTVVRLDAADGSCIVVDDDGQRWELCIDECRALAVDALLDTCERVANDIDGYMDGDWDGVDGFAALSAALRRDSEALRDSLPIE